MFRQCTSVHHASPAVAVECTSAHPSKAIGVRMVHLRTLTYSDWCSDGAPTYTYEAAECTHGAPTYTLKNQAPARLHLALCRAVTRFDVFLG